jgi:hypothetical protein
VHERSRGYIVDPADLFPAETGTLMMPYPLNRGISPAQFQFYTWRDTALQAKGAPADSPGAELRIVQAVLGLPIMPGTPYPQNQVPTIGLPLLMQFKCFPDDGALGLNSFDISIANNNSAKPNFRAFSTGGNNGSGNVTKDPDLEDVATGGFNPSSTPPGQTTLGADNAFYIGQLDLVTRISRAHTIWFDTGSNAPLYVPPVIEPRVFDQPSGTQLNLAYRGATQVVNQGLRTDADKLDAYGDPKWVPPPMQQVPNAVFFENDPSWKSSLADLQGARFFQVRISFISNTQTGLSPELSALGFAYRL